MQTSIMEKKISKYLRTIVSLLCLIFSLAPSTTAPVLALSSKKTTIEEIKGIRFLQGTTIGVDILAWEAKFLEEIFKF